MIGRIASIAFAVLMGATAALAQVPPGTGPMVPNGGSSSITAGSTPITGGASNGVLFNNGGVVTADAGLTKVAGATGTVTLGGQLALPNGLVGTPSLIGAADTNTGIYWPAAAKIGIQSNGVVKLDYNQSNAAVWTIPTASGLILSGNSTVQAGGGYIFGNGSTFTSTGSGAFVYNNNGNSQNFTVSTSATAGQAGFSGAIAATLASATGTNAVCNTPGTTTALTVQVWATGCAASSVRFKDAITGLDRKKAFDTILALEPVSYFYKPEFNMGSDRHIGFTAEQVGSIDPFLITFEDDGVTPHAVKYNEMAPLFAAAIQQLAAKVEALERR